MSEQKQETEAADGQSRLTAWVGMAAITINCDTSPLILFAKIFEAALKGRERFLNFGDFGFELARVESDLCAAGTGELLVRFYPSDAFLRFAATVFAGDFNFGTIQNAGHGFSLPNIQIEGLRAFAQPLSTARLCFRLDHMVKQTPF
jgi:hypothetical protein